MTIVSKNFPVKAQLRTNYVVYFYGNVVKKWL